MSKKGLSKGRKKRILQAAIDSALKTGQHSTQMNGHQIEVTRLPGNLAHQITLRQNPQQKEPDLNIIGNNPKTSIAEVLAYLRWYSS